jgi:hypothetical protein
MQVEIGVESRAAAFGFFWANTLAKRFILGYESKHQPMLSRKAFAFRVARSFAASALLIGVSLLVGMLGYRYTEGMDWLDSFANAAMILSGMGPLAPLQTSSGKLFAGCYALYSGLVLILAAGLLFAPVLHRMLHRFHLESDKKE